MRRKSAPKRSAEPQSDTTKAAVVPADQLCYDPSEDGSRAGRTTYYHGGVPDGQPFRDTWIFGAFKLITDACPVLGPYLADFYDRIIVTSVKQADQIGQDEHEILARQNEVRSVNNAATLAKINGLEGQIIELDRSVSERLTLLDGQIHAAQMAANRKVANAGGSYDPTDTSDEAQWSIKAPELVTVAGSNQETWPGLDQLVTLHPVVVWLVSLVIGAIMGFSFEAALGVIDLRAVNRDGPCLLIAGAVGGIAVSVTSAYVVQAASFWWSSAAHAGKSPRASLTALMAWAVLAIGLGLLHCTVDANGLVRASKLTDALQSLGDRTMGSNPGGTPTFFILCAVVSVPYIAFHWLVGALKGRQAVLPGLQAKAEARHQKCLREHRALPNVPAALEALGEVRLLETERDRLVEQRRSETDRLRSEISAHQATIEPTQYELSERSAWRIRIANDQVAGNFLTFIEILSVIRKAIEGTCNPRFDGRQRLHPWSPLSQIKEWFSSVKPEQRPRRAKGGGK